MMALTTRGAVAQLLMLARVDDRASYALARIDAAGVKSAASLRSAAIAASAARTQLAFMALSAVTAFGAANKSFATFNRQAGITSIVAGQGSKAIGEFSDLANDLSERLAKSPDEMIRLAKSIAQFGLTTRAQIEPVADISTRLALVGEVDAPHAAESIFRLAVITAQAGETMEQTARRTQSLAGAVFLAGSSITAGIPDLLKFVEVFSAVGVIADKLSGEQIIALSAAIADLTPRFREIATTAALRIFATEEFGKLASVLGTSETEVRRMKQDEPLVFFLRVLQEAQKASKDQRLASFMKDLGLGELRSIRGISSELANLERLIGSGDRNLLNLVADPTRNINSLLDASNQLLADNQGAWDRMTAAFQRFRNAAGGALEMVFVPLLNALAGLATAMANPAVAFLLTGGLGLAGLGLGVKTAGVVGRLAGSGAGLLGLRGMLGATGRAGFKWGKFSAITANPTLKAGAMRGAGLFGFLGMQGIGDWLAKGALKTGARGLASRGALGALGVASGPIGWVVLGLQLLAPMFKNLGDTFHNMSKTGGVVGFIFQNIANVFKILALAGNIINLVFDKLGEFFGWILSLFRPIGDAGLKVSGGIGGMLDKANAAVSKARGQGAYQNPTGAAAVNVNTNVNVYDGRDGIDAAMDQAVRDALMATYPSRVPA